MRIRPGVVLAAVTTLVGAAVLLPVAVSATPGPGTFTRITTPSGTKVFHFDATTGSTHNHFVVAGTTSNDVTSVDIACVSQSVTDGVTDVTFASAVPVTAGHFSTTANVANFPTNCRMRALPTGTSLTDYLGSYSGPLLYGNVVQLEPSGAAPYTFIAVSESGDGIAGGEDAGTCGAVLLATILTAGSEITGAPGNSCLLGLAATNITASGTPNASAIKVSGHNAYLPAGVHSYLIGARGLTVAQPAITVTSSAAANGDLHVVESAPLLRCSVSDLYPPNATSCPALVATGVKLVQVTDLFRGAHQIRIRDTFVSTDAHAHQLSAQYQTQVTAPATGATGYSYPGHTTTLHAAAPNQIVTGLGTRAGTVTIRSDVYAGADETTADTLGVTWSRAPSRVVFSSPNVFALPYSLSVPAHGTAFLGFAVTEHLAVAAMRSLANVAVAEMVNVPGISAPHNGRTIKSHRTTVSGRLTPGANGLPTSVKVNGHTAHLKKWNTNLETYTVSFSEVYGSHKLNVTARDVAGNTRTKSIRVRNRHP